MAIFFWISFILFVFIIIFSFYQRSHRSKAGDAKSTENRVVELTDDSFEDTIREGVTLIDFWAPWCVPCRRQNPVINQIANEVGEQAKVCKINVDDHKKAAIRMKIKNIPNVIIFKDGEPVRQLIGLKPKATLKKALQSVIEEREKK
jgi:thioredoxin 1